MSDTKPSDTANMTGGQAPPKDGDASLAQPRDAVPMTNLSTDDAAANTSKAAAASSHPEPNTATGADDSIEPSAKGKEKESGNTAQPAAQSQDDSLAIGPSVDDVQPITVSPTDGPVCNITLLLTTGARHPYKLDEKYLTKRNVNVPGLTEAGKKDPFSISVYTLKELILREWRDEWDPKPASPSSIRLIHFGKLLDDKDQLKQYHFSAEAANVVHMTVRPADIVEEEEPKGGSKSASGGSRNREGGSGCCVIL
uniref:UBL3-like ubiquitin domain-containing protein n=2 Tax=Colletotrichum fructicola (strain Nara gc5) TaxID=1213859 RepID=L2GEM2_COLFN